MAVRLIIITGTCAVGKMSFARRLSDRLGTGVPTFHIDDYIEEPAPEGYPDAWATRRPGYLPVVGAKISEALQRSPRVVFEGVLTGAEEVPALTRAAGLTDPEEWLVVEIQRPLSKCWERKSRDRDFRKRYPYIRSQAEFAETFYRGYLPVGVRTDLTLRGPEADTEVGVELVLRRVGALPSIGSSDDRAAARVPAADRG